MTSAQLEPYLRQCGYVNGLLRGGYTFGGNAGDLSAEWAGFSHQPMDARSACLAVIDCQNDPASIVSKFRPLGAPFTFVCHRGRLHWWQHEVGGSRLLETVEEPQVPAFFERYQREFEPLRVYRAKTRGRFESHYQLSFVDVGLMPLIEGETGQRLGDLIQRLVGDLKTNLKLRNVTTAFGHWMFQSVFWLVAGKILRDKGVSKFQTLSLADPDDVFERVAKHYTASPVAIRNAAERAALTHAATTVSQFASTVNVTTESLAYVYENTLVSRATRAALGTHSTPPWLVDYVVWQLAPFIEKMAPETRHVFEPACGHAAFLVAALRLLREQNPAGMNDSQRLRYLRQHLHGIEVDAFATEIARLSLTLADIPNSNGWDVHSGDMFTSPTLQQHAAKAGILLCNPPFEDFSAKDRNQYRPMNFQPSQVNKAAQILAMTLPHMPAESVIGLVLPQGILQNKSSRKVRETILRSFKVEEVCLFPDKVFAFSGAESVVLIGRKVAVPSNSSIRYRRVGEGGIEGFRLKSDIESEQEVPQSRFRLVNDFVMRIPDAVAIWDYCKDFRRLSDVATIGQGLVHHGRDKLPQSTTTVSKIKFRGAVRGVTEIPVNLQLHGRPKSAWINVSPKIVRRFLAGAPTHHPQVLLNYARVSRGPWKLKAFIDRKGVAFTSNFIAIRPNGSLPLNCLWALCNSPLANAFAHAHFSQRNILVGIIRTLPIPALGVEDIKALDRLVAIYLSSPRRKLLTQIDAFVLRLYNLPVAMETKLLSTFNGKQRSGVPFAFTSYYSVKSSVTLPLHLLLTLPRFHQLVDRKLSNTLDAKQAGELALLENAYDAAEAETNMDSKQLREVEIEQTRSREELNAVERRLQKLLSTGVESR